MPQPVANAIAQRQPSPRDGIKADRGVERPVFPLVAHGQGTSLRGRKSTPTRSAHSTSRSASPSLKRPSGSVRTPMLSLPIVFSSARRTHNDRDTSPRSTSTSRLDNSMPPILPVTRVANHHKSQKGPLKWERSSACLPPTPAVSRHARDVACQTRALRLTTAAAWRSQHRVMRVKVSQLAGPPTLPPITWLVCRGSCQSSKQEQQFLAATQDHRRATKPQSANRT